MRYYAGIGSRNAPETILKVFKTLGTKLAYEGMILRSGGADDSDKAFENGCDAVNGENSSSPLMGGLSDGARKLHARNCSQVLGECLDKPSEFIICYTEGGTCKGGTGQAKGIPIFDFGKCQSFKEVAEMIQEIFKIVRK